MSMGYRAKWIFIWCQLFEEYQEEYPSKYYDFFLNCSKKSGIWTETNQYGFLDFQVHT